MKRFRLVWAWYDIWIGAFWDRNMRTLYLCLIPTVVLVVQFKLSWLNWSDVMAKARKDAAEARRRAAQELDRQLGIPVRRDGQDA